MLRLPWLSSFVWGKLLALAPEVLWQKAPKAMRAVRGNDLEIVSSRPNFWVHRKLPQSTVKPGLPDHGICESKTVCKRSLAAALWVPLSYFPNVPYQRKDVVVHAMHEHTQGSVNCGFQTPGQAGVIGAKNCTQTFFSQTFRALPGYPGKIPGYPAKKV